MSSENHYFMDDASQNEEADDLNDETFGEITPSGVGSSLWEISQHNQSFIESHNISEEKQKYGSSHSHHQSASSSTTDKTPGPTNKGSHSPHSFSSSPFSSSDTFGGFLGSGFFEKSPRRDESTSHNNQSTIGPNSYDNVFRAPSKLEDTPSFLSSSPSERSGLFSSGSPHSWDSAFKPIPGELSKDSQPAFTRASEQQQHPPAGVSPRQQTPPMQSSAQHQYPTPSPRPQQTYPASQHHHQRTSSSSPTGAFSIGDLENQIHSQLRFSSERQSSSHRGTPPQHFGPPPQQQAPQQHPTPSQPPFQPQQSSYLQLQSPQQHPQGFAPSYQQSSPLSHQQQQQLNRSMYMPSSYGGNKPPSSGTPPNAPQPHPQQHYPHAQQPQSQPQPKPQPHGFNRPPQIAMNQPKYKYMNHREIQNITRNLLNQLNFTDPYLEDYYFIHFLNQSRPLQQQIVAPSVTLLDPESVKQKEEQQSNSQQQQRLFGRIPSMNIRAPRTIVDFEGIEDYDKAPILSDNNIVTRRKIENIANALLELKDIKTFVQMANEQRKYELQEKRKELIEKIMTTIMSGDEQDSMLLRFARIPKGFKLLCRLYRHLPPAESGRMIDETMIKWKKFYFAMQSHEQNFDDLFVSAVDVAFAQMDISQLLDRLDVIVRRSSAEIKAILQTYNGAILTLSLLVRSQSLGEQKEKWQSLFVKLTETLAGSYRKVLGPVPIDPKRTQINKEFTKFIERNLPQNSELFTKFQSEMQSPARKSQIRSSPSPSQPQQHNQQTGAGHEQLLSPGNLRRM